MNYITDVKLGHIDQKQNPGHGTGCTICPLVDVVNELGKLIAIRRCLIQKAPIGVLDEDYEELCPACAEGTSYCMGHGEIGDPVGYQILLQHDEGDHSSCNPRACTND